MTVVFGDGMMVKKPRGSANKAPQAAENQKPVVAPQKKRGGKKKEK